MFSVSKTAGDSQNFYPSPPRETTRVATKAVDCVKSGGI